MKVCLICESGYPYIADDVSDWVQTLCKNTSDTEFIIWSIMGRNTLPYAYKLPPNVTKVETTYLSSPADSGKHKKLHLFSQEQEFLRKLFCGVPEDSDWPKILDLIQRKQHHLRDLILSKAFYEICLQMYRASHSTESFGSYLSVFRTLNFSLLQALSSPIPQADVYHCLSAGYGGILGSAAASVTGKPLILTEHSIYARDREEDILTAQWIRGFRQDLYIGFFRRLARIAYQKADQVAALFEASGDLQKELGCPEEKMITIPGGIDPDLYKNLPNLHRLEKGCFHIGALSPVTSVKDIKTMILAFCLVHEKLPSARLSILGPTEEEPRYYQDCLALIRELNIQGVQFLGQVRETDYLPEFNLMLLSGIRESQPLAVLKGMAAGKPFVCTNAGDCCNLLLGREGDHLGAAGEIVPLMDSEAMAAAILKCAENPKAAETMGKIGQKRIETYYRQDQFLDAYGRLYRNIAERRC